jgi:hypothetical protein
MTPWRGIGDVLAPGDFFLILGAAIQQVTKSSHLSPAQSKRRATFTALLFFEQAVESCACVVRVTRCGRRPVSYYLGDGPRWQRVACDSYAGRKYFAAICLIFYCDANRDWFQALEARGRIEMDALLATMQGRPTLRAVSLEIYIGRKCYGTVKASGCHYVLNQPRQLRSSYIDRQSRTLLFGALRAVRTIAAVGVLVSVVPVFAIAVHFG